MSDTKPGLASVYEAHGDKPRFLIVGACNTAFSYVLFIVLLALVGPPLRSLSDSSNGLASLIGHNYFLVVQWVGWVLMVPVSATTMRRFAFRSTGVWHRQVGRAYFVYLPAQGLASLLLWLTVRVLGLSPALGQLVTIAFTTVFSYLGHKYFTFRLPLEVGEVPELNLIEVPRDGVD